MKQIPLYASLFCASLNVFSAEVASIDNRVCSQRVDLDRFIFMTVGAEECSSVRGKTDELCQDFIMQARNTWAEKCIPMSGTFPITKHDEYSGRLGGRKRIKLIQGS